MNRSMTTLVLALLLAAFCLGEVTYFPLDPRRPLPGGRILQLVNPGETAAQITLWLWLDGQPPADDRKVTIDLPPRGLVEARLTA